MIRTLVRIFLIPLVFFGIITFVFYHQKPSQGNFVEVSKVEIGEAKINVIVASTGALRAKGLSDTPTLPEDQGMLFVFEKQDIHSFWMKDMRYPLDIIWIDENNQIVDISENISPDSYPTTYASSLPIRYVLEVNAGFSDLHQIKKGMTVNFLN